MIGFFDSGFGGFAILKKTINLLPQYSYIYLGDNKRAPYGNKDQETIYQFTLKGVKKLFQEGAEIIILACNTSSSNALRRIQQEFLPFYFPYKRVLGIIIPTVEEIGRFTKTKEIGILATEATVNSSAYIKEISKFYPNIKIFQQACPTLVPLIEQGKINDRELDSSINYYLSQLFAKSRKIDTIILGCTHYSLIKRKIKNKLKDKDIKIVSQEEIVPGKIKDYLIRHPEIKKRIIKKRERIFYSTASSEKTKYLARLFYKKSINIIPIKL